jgi:hypothetical protein
MEINIQQINAGNENLESIKIENQRNEGFRGRKRLGPERICAIPQNCIIENDAH